METKSRIAFEIDEATKKRFLELVEKNGQTISKILRLKIQQYILMNEHLEAEKSE